MRRSAMAEPVALAALVIERRWNQPQVAPSTRRIRGVVTVCVLVGLAGGGGLIVQISLMRWAGSFGWVVVALLAFPALAQRSLFEHVRPVARALEGHDLDRARAAVGMIVGRDTPALDEAGVARAAVESLAESFCDGIVAPFFWLLLLGLPGIWTYKAINTADSVIGHKEERRRAFGWAAARTDDLLNLLPARLAGYLICIAGRGGWQVMWRDAGKHASPNAGWPEAAMAGALGLRLAGPIAYDGVMHDKAWIGEGGAAAGAADINAALAIYVRACLLLWPIAGGCAWAL
jgi:adenosylcobinamide-phosphate synthase